MENTYYHAGGTDKEYEKDVSGRGVGIKLWLPKRREICGRAETIPSSKLAREISQKQVVRGGSPVAGVKIYRKHVPCSPNSLELIRARRSHEHRADCVFRRTETAESKPEPYLSLWRNVAITKIDGHSTPGTFSYGIQVYYKQAGI